MNIDFNIFDFVDIVFIVLLPVVLMIGMTFWLKRQQRSTTMILSIWGGFTIIVCVGLTCLLIGIQSARTQWLNYFAEMAAAYAVVVSKLDHWKIVAGDEEIFSDWSEPIKPISGDIKSELSRNVNPRHPETTAENPQEKLTVPEFTTAVRGDNQVFLAWSPVAGATTYRVQWDNLAKETEEDEDWEAVYSGAAYNCVIEAPNPDHTYRIRAETGTPEDDPTYLALMDACDAAGLSSHFIASTYTFRAVDENTSMFIICPPTDMNDNGIVDAN